MKGQIKIADDFDELMNEEDLALWYETQLFPKD